MAPRVKIQRDDIVKAAVELVRKDGEAALNARNVAAALSCSTQPVFSNFATMEALRLAVVKEADALCGEYIRRETQTGEFPSYKAAGMAYIRFAKEEPELFKLLYMRDRRDEAVEGDSARFDQMTALVQNNTGAEEDEAKLFHLEMWAFVHGIAAMCATGFLELDRALISRILTDSYQGLKKQFGKG